jgi:hypothetical protein
LPGCLSFFVLLRFMIPAAVRRESLPSVWSVHRDHARPAHPAHGVSIRNDHRLLGTLFGLGASTDRCMGGMRAHLTGVASEDDITVSAVAGQVRLSDCRCAGSSWPASGSSTTSRGHPGRPVSGSCTTCDRTSPARLLTVRCGSAATIASMVTDRLQIRRCGVADPAAHQPQVLIGTILTNEALAEEVRTLSAPSGWCR